MEYRAISPNELKTILDKHKEWLADNSKGERADLRWADLRWADLSSADLRWADLRWADLRWADLRWANLSSADLRWADLSSADLRWANLSSADLSSADLRWANLSSADLSSADLLIFQFNRHTAYFTKDGALRIGCHIMPITKWKIGYKEIGKKSDYSDVEIETYGKFIDICLEYFNK